MEYSVDFLWSFGKGNPCLEAADSLMLPTGRRIILDGDGNKKSDGPGGGLRFKSTAFCSSRLGDCEGEFAELEADPSSRFTLPRRYVVMHLSIICLVFSPDKGLTTQIQISGNATKCRYQTYFWVTGNGLKTRKSPH